MVDEVGEYMSISIEKMLSKMEAEIIEAKGLNESAVRERVHAIKTLCEVILDQSTGVVRTAQTQQQPMVTPQTNIPGPQQVSLNEKPMKMGDEANGESIFDF
ncbi:MULTISPECIES: YwdI family protein [Cytobacillus]|uniref:YwdI family protein n=1 Tax=Cytobacillus TaxID=2675230 RepID=UPI00203CD8E5|nr:YwdI family protein [Cytobacillus kochii]MCM3322441.1 YwdI family protein [Cytobacillus kochii]MCM3345081.1 YwdI family protein [Cytobacillus kochii]MDM5209636.1 YwdI family protein [Cytobacillus kochii]